MFFPLIVTPMTVVGVAGLTIIFGSGFSSVGVIVKVPRPGLSPVDSGSVLITVSSLSNRFIKEQMVVGVVPAAPALVDPASSLGVVPAERLVVVETSPHTCIEKSVTSIGIDVSTGVKITSMLATPSGLVAGNSNVPWII